MSRQPTNVAVAERLGVSEAAVSRYRDGVRVPRMSTMLLIAEKFRWPIAQQAKAHADNTYGESFERVLRRAFRVRG